MPQVRSGSKKAGSGSGKKIRHDPLHVDLDEDAEMAKYGKVSVPGRRTKRKSKSGDDDEDGEGSLDAKTSKKIIELARDQQEEIALREELGPGREEEDEEIERKEAELLRPRIAFRDSDSDEDYDTADDKSFVDPEEYAQLHIDANDLNTLDEFLPANASARRTLADMIFEKLEGVEDGGDDAGGIKSTSKRVHMADGGTLDPAAGMNPKVVEVYTKIGLLMQKYRSGPLPKAFKIIPSLPGWARILALTSPDQWSPHATRAATRIMVSNLKPEQARVFLEGVLLPSVRSNMEENGGRLNVHLFEALKKAVYKPSAFFKGILFPLCEGGCTLKEASVIASVLSKVSVPALHSSAALAHIAKMEYSGPNSLFIRVLLDKKYALPYKVVDALVFHFINLSNTYKGRKDRGESEILPVLWHQSLLVFSQRYSSDLTPDQKDALLDVIRVNPHAQISLEVRRELVNSVVRGEAVPEAEDVEML